MSAANPLTPKSYKSTPTQKYSDENKVPHFVQFDYSTELYESEVAVHNQSLDEYYEEIQEMMLSLIETNRPNLELYKQQPYLSFAIRSKLIDFLLKMSIRLKILPFVFFRAVRIFDRYCSKRIVLLDQAQLIITTCLWIASKVQGGNNHFVNLNNLEKVPAIKTINDLGYGSGGKYWGPTERFRLPKLHELVKLCGAKCKYDQGMFKQMEIHVLSTLDWSLSDPGIEEYIIASDEFSIMPAFSDNNELFKVKEFLSYICLYAYELIDINILELSQVMMDLINESFELLPGDRCYQRVLVGDSPVQIETSHYKYIKRNMIKAVLNASEYILRLFNTKGPQYFYHQVNLVY
ncbi:cyclin-like protein, partial [Scheffersomyces xylosifermentans]|uniref:cyclin-like protein n=1 Tax=Scheffersomyces xylosifermentans TaxID=1304137 RepID=UPI00315DAF68